MNIIIDGYNLIFSAGIGGTETGPRALQRARGIMLRQVRKRLTHAEARSTTIVFDAKRPPPGLPAELEHDGVKVLFAKNHDEADDLIEELIRQHSTPRKLTIVTSDQRLRQAAARRRAKSITIDEWLDFLELRDRANARSSSEECSSDGLTRDVPLTAEQTERWMREFELNRDDRSMKPLSPENAHRPSEKRKRKDCDWGPFPPGYGEDLLD